MKADSDAQWPLVGVIAVAASIVSLAYVIATRDPEAEVRVADRLRADIDKQYDAFCERFGRSPSADRGACMAALLELRQWEDARRVRDDPNAYW